MVDSGDLIDAVTTDSVGTVPYDDSASIGGGVDVDTGEYDQDEEEASAIVQVPGVGTKGAVAKRGTTSVMDVSDLEAYVAIAAVEEGVAVAVSMESGSNAASALFRECGKPPELAPPAGESPGGLVDGPPVPRALDRSLDREDADTLLRTLANTGRGYAVTFPDSERSATYIRGNVGGDGWGGEFDTDAEFVGVRRASPTDDWSLREYDWEDALRRLVRARSVRMVTDDDAPDDLYPWKPE